MERLIFINENYQLNLEETEKFITILKMEDVILDYLPFIEKKVSIDELFFLFNSNYFIRIKNKIIYQNLFTKEKVEFVFIDGKIYVDGLKKDSSLKRYLYLISTNHVII